MVRIHDQRSVSYPVETRHFIDGNDVESLQVALEDAGVMPFGISYEEETGFFCIEFSSAEEAERFLTMVLVTMDDQAIPRIMGQHGDDCSWIYETRPIDCRVLLDPDYTTLRPRMPFAVALVVSIRFPVADYHEVMGFIGGQSEGENDI